ncbi:FAD-dependent oxidoreductase, partial [Devosia sp.]|uniref:FAD-dependent oxidoreductase n=1 Tax=Devosia sp. TaxID=1871048 RepID=UPI002EDF881B
MSGQPDRLAAAETHKFAGTEIDRGRPLSFRLNGRVIHGFAGDTVLSAVLAAGIGEIGRKGGEPIGLGESFAPAVIAADLAGDPAAALPMERTPALPGLDLVTLGGLRRHLLARGPLARLRHWLGGPGRTLDLGIDDPALLAGEWRALQPPTPVEADIVVVGGGVAGMTAAVAAAAAGDRVVLVERTPALGGNARYFGSVDNEEPPEAAIARLVEDLARGGVMVFTRTEAFALAGTSVHAHRVEAEGDRVVPRTLCIAAKRVVLATGALECRPAFPGNRAPGVGGATDAFRLADRYGVWPGRRTLFSTTNNFGYRLALLAKDAGVQVQRIADTRLNPQSRFIDFVKASGITLAHSLVPRAALPVRRGQAGLAVSFAVAIDDIHQETAPIQTDRLVVAGHWQPDLTLWLMAGGACGWNPQAHWLEARGTLAGVALAGSAAGYRNGAACMQSGIAAVAGLRGRAVPAIDDAQIDPVFESPDGQPRGVGVDRIGRYQAYLGAGSGFAPYGGTRQQGIPATAALRQALALDELATSVRLGELPATEAGGIAAEHCLAPGRIADGGWRPPPAAPRPGAEPVVPAYLAGRFGAKPRLCVIG